MSKIFIATTNKRKVLQFKQHMPKGSSVAILSPSNPEVKHSLPELVSFYKALELRQQGYENVITDDRALYLQKALPGTEINAFLQNPKLFDNLFIGKRGKLVYALTFANGDGIHVYSHFIRVKILPPSKKRDEWGELGRRLAVLPKNKPIAEYNNNEKIKLEEKLSREIFMPFFSSIFGTSGKTFFRDYSEITRVNKWFMNMQHTPLKKLEQYIKTLIDKEEEVNALTLRKRVLLSAAYYPLKTFFDIDVAKSSIIFNIPLPDEKIKEQGKELIAKLIEFHRRKLDHSQRKAKIIKELEQEEATKPEGKIKSKNGKIYVVRKGVEEEVYFKEYKNYEIAEKALGELHYLNAPRPWIKVYALVDKENRPLALISIARVERNYKKKFLNMDNAQDAVEVARGYNTMWKVKGVLSILFSKLSSIYPVLLTAYQPSFARGISIYSANFSPYIIKPQQNFYVFEGDIPVFTVRRALKGKHYKIGKMPLLPSMEMISPALRFMHFINKLMD